MAMKRSTQRNGTRHNGARPGHALGAEWLKNFLSEMLAVEMGGVKLYEKAISELAHQELEEELTHFLHETEYHVELCTEMLTAAGADTEYRSPTAQAAEHKAEGLISVEVPAEFHDLSNIENLVIAETKDHWDWATLASIAPKIGDPDLKRIVSKAVREVRKQEKRHLDWNEKTLSKLALEAAMHSPEREEIETEATEREAMAVDWED
jgi:hypothetical protein